MADHIADRNRRVFVDHDAIGAEVHGGYAGCVDDAWHIGFAGQAQQVACAVNVGAVHCIGVSHPQAVVGRNVNQSVATLERGGEGLRVGEVTDDSVAGNAFDVGELAGFADQHAQIGSFGSQCLRHMVAYEAGRACQEYPHRRNRK